MKKRMKKIKTKAERALGIVSAIALGASLFMGYNRLTGNVISTGSEFNIISIGGVALFVLGILGVFLIAKE